MAKNHKIIDNNLVSLLQCSALTIGNVLRSLS